MCMQRRDLAELLQGNIIAVPPQFQPTCNGHPLDVIQTCSSCRGHAILPCGVWSRVPKLDTLGRWQAGVGRAALGVCTCGAAMASDGTVSEGSKLKSAQLLDMVRTHLTTDAGKELQTKVGFVYQINIAPKKMGFEEESFVVDLKNLKVYKGKAEGKPDATFSFVDSDFIGVATGKMNPQMAFIRGKMKIKGSMSAAQKFTPDIFPKPAKL